MMRLDVIRNTGSSNYETDYSHCLMSKAKVSEGCVKKRETKITVESHEVLVIKQRGSVNRVWCAACGKQVAEIGAQPPPKQTDAAKMFPSKKAGPPQHSG